MRKKFNFSTFLVALLTVGLMLGSGIQMAAASIDSGKARQKLDQLIEFSAQCQPFVRG